MPKLAINREDLILIIQSLLKEDDDALLFKLHADSRKVLEELKTKLSSWKGVTLSQEETKQVLSYIAKINPDHGSSSKAAIQRLKGPFDISSDVEKFLYVEDTTPQKRLYLQSQCSRVVDLLSSENPTLSREQISIWISKTISSLLIKDRETVLAGETWSWDFYNSLVWYVDDGEVLYQRREFKNISRSMTLKSFMELYEICSLSHISFCKCQNLMGWFVKSYNLYPQKKQKNFEEVLDFIGKIAEKDNNGDIKGIQFMDVFRSYKEKGLFEALILLLFRPDITSEQCGEILKNLQHELYNSKSFELGKGLQEQVKKYFNSTAKWNLNWTKYAGIELTLKASNNINICLRLSPDSDRINLYLLPSFLDDKIEQKIESFNNVMHDILNMIFFEPYMKRIGNDREPMFMKYDDASQTYVFLPTIKQLKYLNLFLFPDFPSDLVSILYYNGYFKEVKWNRCHYDEGAEKFEKVQGDYVYHNHIDLVQYFIQNKSTGCIVNLWETNCFSEDQRKEIFVFLEKTSDKEEIKKLYDKLIDLGMGPFQEGDLNFEKYFLKNGLTWLSEKNQDEGLAFLLTHEINKDTESLRPFLKRNPFIWKYVVYDYKFLNKENILTLLFQLKKNLDYLDAIKDLKMSQKTEKPYQRIERLKEILNKVAGWRLINWEFFTGKENAFFIDVLKEFDNDIENPFSFFKGFLNEKGNDMASFHFEDNPKEQDSDQNLKL